MLCRSLGNRRTCQYLPAERCCYGGGCIQFQKLPQTLDCKADRQNSLFMTFDVD